VTAAAIVSVIAGIVTILVAVIAIWIAIQHHDRAQEANKQLFGTLNKIEAQTETLQKTVSNPLDPAFPIHEISTDHANLSDLPVSIALAQIS
jgi:hypothetical protein